MRKLLRSLRFGWDIALTLVGIVRLILWPKNISPIFRVKSIRNHRSFDLCLKSIKSDPQILALIRERYLAPKAYDLDELVRLPSGTLGREYADHMIRNKLQVEFYPPLDAKEDDDLNYVRRRARQTHDLWHVACGFPTEDIGEMAVSAFYLSQHSVPLSAMLIGTGFFYVIFREPHRVEELMNALIYGWNMGKNSEHLFAIKWEEEWKTPLIDLRRRLKIDVKDGFFESNRGSLAQN